MNRKRVEVDLTPQFVHAHTIICDVDPPKEHHKGGHIRLPRGQSYTLAFKLQPGSPANLHFKPDQGGKCDAFWSHPHDCPTHAMNVPEYEQPRLTAPDRLEVDVNVEHVGEPSAVHYRLNFDDGRYFDPIIIHD
jgi:hypothetical protein